MPNTSQECANCGLRPGGGHREAPDPQIILFVFSLGEYGSSARAIELHIDFGIQEIRISPSSPIEKRSPEAISVVDPYSSMIAGPSLEYPGGKIARS